MTPDGKAARTDGPERRQRTQGLISFYVELAAMGIPRSRASSALEDARSIVALHDRRIQSNAEQRTRPKPRLVAGLSNFGRETPRAAPQRTTSRERSNAQRRVGGPRKRSSHAVKTSFDNLKPGRSVGRKVLSSHRARRPCSSPAPMVKS